jgi:hypothetical protein
MVHVHEQSRSFKGTAPNEGNRKFLKLTKVPSVLRKLGQSIPEKGRPIRSEKRRVK